jgi:hypothetical protein
MNGQNASINLITNADSTLSLIGGGAGATAPSSSSILLGSVAALGVNDILFGNPSTDGIALYQSTANSGELQVGNNFSGVNIASFNQNTNAVVLGKQSVAGTVNLNGVTTVNLVGGSNSLSLAPVSSTNSIINQTIATSGTIGIGSSTTFPQTLRVSDVPYLGADCYVEVFGPPATVPLFISAAQGPAGECGIHPDTIIDGSGQLLLGSDNNNVSAIRIASTATTINNLGGAPQVLLAAQTIAPNASGTIPNPTGEGLYCIMGCSVATSSGQTRQAQVNVMAYVNTNGRIQMGGSGIADIGSIGGTDAFVLFPVDGTNTLFYQNNGAQSLLNYSIVAFKISGPILGAF